MKTSVPADELDVLVPNSIFLVCAMELGKISVLADELGVLVPNSMFSG